MAEKIPEGKTLSPPSKQYVRWLENISPYQILEVEEDATDEEIKGAYRSLAKQYHPDVLGELNDNPEMMALISTAYTQILKGEDVYNMPSSYTPWHLRVRPDSKPSLDGGSKTLCGLKFPPMSELARTDAEESDDPKCEECTRIGNIGLTYKRRSE